MTISNIAHKSTTQSNFGTFSAILEMGTWEPVTNLEFLFTLYKVKTRPNPMKGGVTMCRRAPRA